MDEAPNASEGGCLMSWYRGAGTIATDNTLASVTPELAGWTYSGLHVIELSDGPWQTELTDNEAVVVPLSATDVTVTIDGREWVLRGRAGVFAAVSDWIYVPVGATVSIHGASGEVAICTSVAEEVHPVAYCPAESVRVEIRGSGMSTRQVTNIATPDSFAGAHKINVCEVLTPGGNWSSWPPHRHDGITDCPTTNEEIYYFRLGRGESTHGDPDATGLFHVYTVDGRVDETVSLRDGDVYLVPEGFHGPTVAPPEYPMYFLNVLAGPSADRTMAFCDDPAHHWIRESWQDQAPDPRCPMTSAEGRVSR
jgi:5-deoxy-glucuronate isomerase